MGHRSTGDGAGSVALAALHRAYMADRDRVEAAQRRLRAVTDVPHTPPEARRAATELAAALRQATATAARALSLLGSQSTTLRRSWLRHRKASLRVPAAIRFWSTEIMRLGDIDGRLARTTVDDLGVLVPATVRLGSRAATGPHVAGLVAEPASLIAATLHEPRIGVDLRAIIDAVDHSPAPAAALAPSARSAPTTSTAGPSLPLVA